MKTERISEPWRECMKVALFFCRKAIGKKAVVQPIRNLVDLDLGNSDYQRVDDEKGNFVKRN